MQDISISVNLADKIPWLQLSCIECDVEVQGLNEELWRDAIQKIDEIALSLKIEQISTNSVIMASRKAYRLCGKDPARYRLSSEALLRRVVNRNELYQLNNVVDLLNLVSISTGFSIGGYDVEKIQGKVVFGIGRKEEKYIGIGRGELNIEFLPVFRDEVGPFGSPTSDSERTAVSKLTKRFLMIIVGFGAVDVLPEATQLSKILLEKYANAKNLEFKIIKTL